MQYAQYPRHGYSKKSAAHEVANPALRNALELAIDRVVIATQELSKYEINDKMSSMIDSYFAYLRQKSSDKQSLNRWSTWLLRYSKSILGKIAEYTNNVQIKETEDSLNISHFEITALRNELMFEIRKYLVNSKYMQLETLELIVRATDGITANIEKMTNVRAAIHYDTLKDKLEFSIDYLKRNNAVPKTQGDPDGGRYLLRILQEVYGTTRRHHYG